MSPPLRPGLRPGDVLAGRYRLVEQVSTGSTSTLWKAADEVLARPVAVRVLPAGGPGASDADRFLDAVAEAGAVDVPVFARVYDAALEERAAEQPAPRGEQRGRPAGSLDIAYVIREWVEGRPLDEALRADGPLEPDAARGLVAGAARGLAAATQRGVAHGRLHPGNVALTPDGRLKVLDLGVSAALPGAPPADPARDQARDTRDLGALLYALLTARWPTAATDQPAGALPAAPVRDGRPRRAGQVRRGVPRMRDRGVPRTRDRGVPRGLDELLAALLAGDRSAPATAAELARALERTAPDDSRPARDPRLSPRARRRVPALLVVAFLFVVGATSYVAGRQIGAVETTGGALETLVEPSAAPPAEGAAGGGGPVDLLGAAQVTDFDPPPGDGRENPGAVPNAYDGDPSTVWETERYSSAQLGGLKEGVGLLVDFGAPLAVAQVELGLRPGSRVELRAADALGSSLEDFPVVATGGGDQVVRLEAGQTARYWLVVLTELPPEPGGFRGGIAEMVFLRG